MQRTFLLFAFFALIGLVWSDGSTVSKSLAAIQKSVDRLQSGVAGYNGALTQALGVSLDSVNLLSALHAGTLNCKNSAVLTNEEVVGIASLSQSLVASVNQTSKVVVNKARVFEKNLLGPIIKINLKLQLAASDRFTESVIDIVPPALQAATKQVTAPISVALKAAIAAFR